MSPEQRKHKVTISRHTIVKLVKISDNDRMPARKWHVMYRRINMRFIAYFSVETMQMRRQCSNFVKVLRKIINLKFSTQKKKSFKIRKWVRTFQDVQKWMNSSLADLHYRKCLGCPSSQRKMIWNGHFNLHQGIYTRNGNYYTFLLLKYLFIYFRYLKYNFILILKEKEWKWQ